MTTKIDISGIGKAELLAALFNAAYQHMLPERAELDVREARWILAGGTIATPYKENPYHVDSVKGLLLDVDLSGDSLDPSGYDRQNGANAARLVVERLRLQAAPCLRTDYAPRRRSGAPVDQSKQTPRVGGGTGLEWGDDGMPYYGE